jgi:tRNA (guanine-N1)-methyltransferase
LMSGHHAKVAAWRKKKALELTKKLRPDLLKNIGGR